jgi:hypothetical protein
MIDQIDIKFKDYAIGGKMITAKVVVDEQVMVSRFSNEDGRQAMRSTMVARLAEAMLENRLCEITQYKNPIDFSTTIVARAYVAPDDMVKLLRTIDA